MPAFQITYWGTTGTLAKTRSNLVYGGDTTCIEIQAGVERILIDCGSGLRDWGREIERLWNSGDYQGPRRATILLTHAHMDHLCALPLCMPFYDPLNEITFIGPQWALGRVQSLFDEHAPLARAFFPTTFAEMKAVRSLKPMAVGDELQIGGVRISSHALNHPGGCAGYRLECGGRRFVFATDHEQTEVPDPVLAEFARDADLLYSDAQFLADEYEGRIGVGSEPPMARRGWGHSTVEAAVTTAVAAGVRWLHLGHHEPTRSDAELAAVETHAQQLMAAALSTAGKSPDACRVELAREDLSIEL